MELNVSFQTQTELTHFTTFSAAFKGSLSRSSVKSLAKRFKMVDINQISISGYDDKYYTFTNEIQVEGQIWPTF